MTISHSRRDFLKRSLTIASAAEMGIILYPRTARAAVPRDDPTARLKLPWTRTIKWDNVLDITTMPGTDWANRLANAQKSLTAKGGGVVYFPTGRYVFTDSVTIADGIVLRGDNPNVVDAKSDAYKPPTLFEFPRYEPRLEGEGTPIETAFKGIYLADPARASSSATIPSTAPAATPSNSPETARSAPVI